MNGTSDKAHKKFLIVKSQGIKRVVVDNVKPRVASVSRRVTFKIR